MKSGRILYVLLALVLCLCLSPVSVMADEPTIVEDYYQLVAAFNQGGSIVLGNNITALEPSYLVEDMTIDLNGKTLNLGNNRMFVGGDVIIKDSSSDNSGRIQCNTTYPIQVMAETGENGYRGKLTVQSGTLTTTGKTCIRVNGYGTLIVNGGKIQGTQIVIYNSGSGAYTEINGGTVEADAGCGVYVVPESTLKVNNGSIEAQEQTIVNKGDTEINNGIVKAKSGRAVAAIYNSEAGSKLTVNGGTIQASESTILTKDGSGSTIEFNNGTVMASNHTGIYVGNGSTLSVKDGTIRADLAAINVMGKAVIDGGRITAYGVDSSGVAIQVKGDMLTEEDNLTVNGGIIESLGKGAAINLHSNCAVTVNGGTIEAKHEGETFGDSGIGISVFQNTRLKITGGEVTSCGNALESNGSASGGNSGINAEFIIDGGTLTSTNGAGIYAPQINGKTTIGAGTITGGRSGVEVRAGELTITGGTITGNLARYDTTGTDGTSRIGSAVSVFQNSAKQPITVNISDGNFYGYIPLSESSSNENGEEDLKKINYAVSGGTFHASGDKAVCIEDYLNGKFISGGRFSHSVTSPTDYVVDTSMEIRTTSADLKYSVVPRSSSSGGSTLAHIITVLEGENGTVKANRKQAGAGRSITLTVTPDEGFAVESVKVLSKKGEEIAATRVSDTEYTFEMPAAGVTCYATFAENALANPFEDVEKDDPFYDAVLWAFYHEPQITNGTDKTHFSPENTVIRGDAVTFLWRTMGEPEPENPETPFGDLTKDYYMKAVAWAVEQGIALGTDAEHFSPGGTLTTAQMITFLYRTLNPGEDGWSEDDTGGAAKWAKENGLMEGIDLSIDNTTPCPRSAVVMLLNNASSGRV